jgi:hypothetical protein
LILQTVHISIEKSLFVKLFFKEGTIMLIKQLALLCILLVAISAPIAAECTRCACSSRPAYTPPQQTQPTFKSIHEELDYAIKNNDAARMVRVIRQGAGFDEAGNYVKLAGDKTIQDYMSNPTVKRSVEGIVTELKQDPKRSRLNQLQMVKLTALLTFLDTKK